MIIKNTTALGTILALLAGAINASIGIISILLMKSHLKSNDVAFLKTAIACLLLFAFLSRTPHQKQKQYIIGQETTKKSFWFVIAVCAFMGIFVLFLFETMAYQYGNPANVVVVLMASAVISATIFGAVLLGEKITSYTLIGSSFSIVGIFVISWAGGADALLVIYGILAGSGYGVFSVLVQKFGLNGGIYLTKYLLLFGALFLAIPFAITYEPITVTVNMVLGLLALAFFPSILGFYCTTSALKYLSASKVQVIELSEPLFAMFFAWVILHEQPTAKFWLGAGCVIIGVLIITLFNKETIQENNQ